MDKANEQINRMARTILWRLVIMDKPHNHVDVEYSGESKEEFQEKVKQQLGYKDNVVPLTLYGVYEYDWGTGILDEARKRWVKAYLKPNALEIDFEALGIDVELHLNGIEFL